MRTRGNDEVQVIDLGDDLEFEVLPWAGTDELTCNMEDVPTDNSNLVVKVRSSLYYPLLWFTP